MQNVSIPSSRPPVILPLSLFPLLFLSPSPQLLIVFNVERSTLVVSHNELENEQEFDFTAGTGSFSVSGRKKVFLKCHNVLFPLYATKTGYGKYNGKLVLLSLRLTYQKQLFSG